MLIASRFFLGIGVGAEYPCGSVAASEQSEEPGINKNAQHRWFALATSEYPFIAMYVYIDRTESDTMIDSGFVVAAFVPLVLFWIFGDNHLRAVWRLSLGLGVIPALAVFIWRLRMDEPSRFKESSMNRGKTPYWLILKRYWKSLLGLCIVWFIYDFITYPFGIYSSTVVDRCESSVNFLHYINWILVRIASPMVALRFLSSSAGMLSSSQSILLLIRYPVSPAQQLVLHPWNRRRCLRGRLFWAEEHHDFWLTLPSRHRLHHEWFVHPVRLIVGFLH